MVNRKALIFFVFLLLAFGSLLAIQVVSKIGQDRESSAPILRVGDFPKPLQVTTMEGEKISLENLKGKVVLINFWATWCPPCIDEIPTLVQSYNDLKNKGFEILSFSIDANGPKILPEFLRKHGVNYPVIIDADQRFARHFSVLGVPENILLDKEGKVTEKRYGADDWTDPKVRKLITNLISKNK